MKPAIVGLIAILAILFSGLATILQNPLIVSVTVSLGVSLVVLGLDKLLLTPRARKRAYELRDLEKRLDALGELVALLRATRKKATAFWRENTSAEANRHPHYVEQHDIRALDRLFGEEARLMPPKLSDLWIDQLRQETLEAIDETRQRTISPKEKEWHLPQFVMLDLREMEPLAESEYKKLVSRWEKLAGIKLD